jgi:hypothetical protein
MSPAAFPVHAMSSIDHRPTSAPAACAWLLPRLISRLAPFLLLALAACMPGNENSVIDRPLANDARMPGLWVGRLGDDDLVVLRITAETPEILLVDVGIYAEDAAIARYRAARTKIGGRDILELTETDASSRAGVGAKMDLGKRFFVAYAFDGEGRLTVNLQNDLTTPLEKAVDQGALAGHSEDRAGNTRTLVTAPTPALRDFVAKTPDVFGTPPIVFTKVPLPAK